MCFKQIMSCVNFTAFLMQQLLSLPLEAANKNEKKPKSKQKIKSPILEDFFNYFLWDRFYPDITFYV